ncbi:MAG: pyridoxamine 5'-phosphate oxidase family protein [Candidatus Thorarchaeota archaeon]|jgi:nitroimidazol reductase NimA-like FMN-containing flavoprotein (pyridoxamine 5'-phosphate oxidase superfamily)
MRGIRRKEKKIESEEEMIAIIMSAQYVTVAMSTKNEPYLATLSHGYDREKNCIYFHCAQEGKKIDILNENNVVWGQALEDHGYAEGACDHLYATTQFKGKVVFVKDAEEKRHALSLMVHQIEPNPEKLIEEQVTEDSVKRINIGRIDIEYMSGKKTKEVVISL